MRLLCTILLCLLVSPVWAAQGPGFSTQYHKVFYPDGMPLRKDPFGPEKLITAYRFHDQVNIPGTRRIAVVFSEQTLPEPLEDTKFWVFLGVLERRGRLFRVLSVRELTDFFPVNLEAKGTFRDMDARINAFYLSPKDVGVHVNLWSVLSGTGATSGASDLFFRAQEKGELELLLELKQTSFHTREGAGTETTADSQLWMADLDRDRVADVIAQEKLVKVQEGEAKPSLRRPAPAVYKLVGGKYEHVAGVKKVDLPKGALALRRSPRIPKATLRRK